MEEDIEILKDTLEKYCYKNCKGEIDDSCKECKRLKAIKNLIKEFRDGEDIIKEAVKENLELKQYIRELEEELNTSISSCCELFNLIPKSKIKEKIEPVIDSLEKDGFVGYADELRDIISELMEEK